MREDEIDEMEEKCLSRHLNVLLNNMRKLCLNWTIEGDGLQSLLISIRHSCVMHTAYRKTKTTTTEYMDYRTGDSIHFLSFFFYYVCSEWSLFFPLSAVVDEWMNGMPEFKWPFMLCHVTKVFLGDENKTDVKQFSDCYAKWAFSKPNGLIIFKTLSINRQFMMIRIQNIDHSHVCKV